MMIFAGCCGRVRRGFIAANNRNLAGEAVGQDDTCQDRRIIRTIASLNESIDWLRVELTTLFATLPFSDNSSHEDTRRMHAGATKPVSLDRLKQLRALLADLCQLSEKFYAFLFLEVRMQTLCAMQYLFSNGLNAVGKDAVETIETISTQLSMVHWNYALTIGARIASDKVICVFRTLPQFVGDTCIEMSHLWRRVDAKSARALQRMLHGVGSQLKKIVEQHAAAAAANTSSPQANGGVFVPGPGAAESPYVSMLNSSKAADEAEQVGNDGSAQGLLFGIEHAKNYFALVQQVQPEMLLERLEKEKTLRFGEREYATLLKLMHRQAALLAESSQQQLPIDNVELERSGGGSGVVKKKQLNLDRDLAKLSTLFEKYSNQKQFRGEKSGGDTNSVRRVTSNR